METVNFILNIKTRLTLTLILWDFDFSFKIVALLKNNVNSSFKDILILLGLNYLLSIL